MLWATVFCLSRNARDPSLRSVGCGRSRPHTNPLILSGDGLAPLRRFPCIDILHSQLKINFSILTSNIFHESYQMVPDAMIVETAPHSLYSECLATRPATQRSCGAAEWQASFFPFVYLFDSDRDTRASNFHNQSLRIPTKVWSSSAMRLFTVLHLRFFRGRWMKQTWMIRMHFTVDLTKTSSLCAGRGILSDCSKQPCLSALMNCIAA